MIDLFLVYQFIKRLATAFTSWAAYKSGVIDAEGNILVKKPNRTPEQRASFKTFDLMVLKLKRLLGKLPGGSSKIASYAAALWLIREWNEFSLDSMLTEDVAEFDINQSLDGFVREYLEMMEDGMSAGSGAIAGIGIGPDGEPGITLNQRRKYRKHNTSEAPSMGRRIMPVSLGEEDDGHAEGADEGKRVRRRYVNKRHTIPTAAASTREA